MANSLVSKTRIYGFDSHLTHHALLAQSVEANDLRSFSSEFKSLEEHKFSRKLEHHDLVSDGMNDDCKPSVLGSIPSEVF